MGEVIFSPYVCFSFWLLSMDKVNLILHQVLHHQIRSATHYNMAMAFFYYKYTKTLRDLDYSLFANDNTMWAHLNSNATFITTTTFTCQIVKGWNQWQYNMKDVDFCFIQANVILLLHCWCTEKYGKTSVYFCFCVVSVDPWTFKKFLIISLNLDHILRGITTQLTFSSITFHFFLFLGATTFQRHHDISRQWTTSSVLKCHELVCLIHYHDVSLLNIHSTQ